ncbi:MAG: cysteine hydrolase [Nitrospirae bacterium]|nr:cysteine hydrolase [Nitrospirota bacterium]
MSKKALIIIDMLNDFVREGAPLEVPDTRKVVPVIKREIETARKNGWQIIYICDSHDPDDKEFNRFKWPVHAVKGTKGALIIDELRPSNSDIIIEKTTYSGFYRTKLDSTLRALRIDTLRITGCVTHICVLFTASDAVLRGYDVEVVKDGVAGTAPEDHDAALRIMRNVLNVKVLSGGY